MASISDITVFSFLINIFVSYLRNYPDISTLVWGYSSVFSFRSFLILPFSFRSIICLDLNFVYYVKQGSCFDFTSIYKIGTAWFIKEMILSPLLCSAIFVINIMSLYMVVYFWAVWALWFVCVSLCLNYCSSVIRLNI